jgi:hypothetical protein
MNLAGFLLVVWFAHKVLPDSKTTTDAKTR